MEHKTPGVGAPTGVDASPDSTSPEQSDAAPRRKRSRSGNRGEPEQLELAVAGVAWRPSGPGRALVVLARGHGVGGMRSSFATLNVFHGGEPFPVTAPVTATVGEGGASSSRQTLRFVFRLPASAAAWRIERMVLRWRGTEVELPPPAPPPEGAFEGEPQLSRVMGGGGGEPESSGEVAEAEEADEDSTIGEGEADEGSSIGGPEEASWREPEDAVEPVPEVENSHDVVSEPYHAPSEPGPGRYGAEIAHAEDNLALLHEEIVSAKLELAQLHAELAQARLQYEEAAMASEYAQRERDRAEQWLVDVTSELEDVERQLAECRSELVYVSRELAARLAAVAEHSRTSDTPVSEPDPAAPPSPSPRNGDARSAAERDLNAALSDLRSRLDQVLSEPLPVWGGDNAVNEKAPVEEAPVEEEAVPTSDEEAVPTTAEGAVPTIDESAESLSESLTPADTVERDELADDDAALQNTETLAQEPSTPAIAPDEQPTPRIPASLPSATDREDGESSWFAAALRRLAQDDREAAGRLLVSVLPAQAIATPRSFRYDLVVRDDGVYAVDAHPLDTRVELLEVPRPMDQTDAWIMGSLGQLGDLIAHGKSSFLRLFNRHGLKVKGQRARLDDLLALATAPLRLRDLCAVGAPIQPHLLLQMIASSIDPSWIDARPLSIRLDPREDGMPVCSLRIQDGSPIVLGAESTAAADFGEVTTIAEGSARSLMRLLAGLPSPQDDQANVRGPLESVEVLQGWVRRLELSSM